MTDTLYTEGQYLELHPDWHVADSTWKAEHILRLLSRNNVRPHSVCEVGCGAGEILASIQAALPPDVSFTGYDISPQALALAERRANGMLHFERARIEEKAGAHFDVLMLIDVIEHVENYFELLRDVRDKATYKVLHIPLDLSVQTVLRVTPILGNRRTAGHIHYFTSELALATLHDCGYTVVDHSYTAVGIERPSTSLKMWWARWPRALVYKRSPALAARILGGFSLLVLAQ